MELKRPPENSLINANRGVNSVELILVDGSDQTIKTLHVLGWFAYAMLGVVGPFGTLTPFLTAETLPSRGVDMFFIGGLLFLTIGTLGVFRYIRIPASDSAILEPSGFIYKRGCRSSWPINFKHVNSSKNRHVNYVLSIISPEVALFEKHKINNLALRYYRIPSEVEKLYLFLDFGNRRITLCDHLSDSDKAWLYETLKVWLKDGECAFGDL
ncbi:MAG: hypothetical protein AAGA67_03965 [Cyanobacteria bacterium P01_F01_bin.153]